MPPDLGSCLLFLCAGEGLIVTWVIQNSLQNTASQKCFYIARALAQARLTGRLPTAVGEPTDEGAFQKIQNAFLSAVPLGPDFCQSPFGSDAPGSGDSQLRADCVQNCLCGTN